MQVSLFYLDILTLSYWNELTLVFVLLKALLDSLGLKVYVLLSLGFLKMGEVEIGRVKGLS